MSKKSGKVLVDLWNRVDQADYDIMIEEMLTLLQTSDQNRFIERILDNNQWDLNGEPSEKEKEEIRKLISK